MKSVKSRSSMKGFTLIEVAIALMVIGLLAAPLIQSYNSYRMNKAIQDSTGNLIVVKSALQKYALKWGHYPKPAVPGLASTDAMFGQETSATIAACAANVLTVCSTTGYRNVDGIAGNDPVYIGIVPFATLGLPREYAYDGYGSRITYAVTASLTSAATFKDANGVLRVVQKNGAVDSTANDSAHYVLVSHGNDRVGAVNSGGTYTFPCPTTATSADQTNCNKDGSFNNNLAPFGVSPDIVYRRYASIPSGVNHFDDFIDFTTSTTGDLWSRAANTSNMYSRAAGNVRIGPSTLMPVAKVEVAGNIKASTKVITNKICAGFGCESEGSTSGLAAPAYAPNAFVPGIIQGTPNPLNAGKEGGGILCGSNQAMTGISYSNEECDLSQFPPSNSAIQKLGDCNSSVTHLYPVGITAAGKLDCK